MQASPIGTGLGSCNAVAVDGSGNVYIADGTNRVLVKETLSGGSYVQTTVTSLPSNAPTYLWPFTVDGSGNIYIGDSVNNQIIKETLSAGSYTQSTVVSGLQNGINAIAVDQSGNLYYTDQYDRAAVKLTWVAGGYQQSMIGSTDMGVLLNGVAVDRNGNVFISGVGGGGGMTMGVAYAETLVNGSYVQSILNLGLTIPYGLSVDAAGNVYIAGNGGVLEESPVFENSFGAVNIGTTSTAIPMAFTFDTSGTLGSTAVLTQGATGLDFSDAGADTCMANTAYAAGQTCTVNVAFTPRFAGTRSGAVVLKNGSGNSIATGYLQGMGVGPQIIFQPGVQSTLGSGFSQPASVAVDGKGNIYVSDVGSGVLYEMVAVNGTVPASPTIKTIGSGFGSVAFVTVDGAGNLYVADTVNNAVKEVLAANGSIPASPVIRTFSSGIMNPAGIAVDGNGNVYVTAMADSSVREIVAVNGSIPASPVIRTLGSGFHNPIGIAVDASGNVYVADSTNNAVKEILAVNGSVPVWPTIVTLGSGFYQPYGLALDGSGNLYVADYGNSAVKEILAVNGSIPTSPTIITLGSGFSKPGDVAVDGRGNVYVDDTANNRMVKLDFADPPSLTFSSTVIGSSSPDSPRTITVENAGNAPLTFPIPSSGNNPSVSANFTLNSSGSLDCPLLTNGSSEPGTLAPGESCQLPISFVPTSAGSFSGSLVLTDSNLNAPAPGYTSQNILLSGTETGSFTLGSSVTSLTMTQGSSATSTITVTGQNGFNGNVNLTASGLPWGVTASFSPNPTAGTSVLTLTASSTSSLASSVVITVSGTAGSLTSTTTLLLTVNQGPYFTLGVSPASLNLAPGASVTSGITVTGQAGFTGGVDLTASGLPIGVTASFTPSPATGTSVLTLTASNTAISGTYNVTINGTSGPLTSMTTLVLAVGSPSFTLGDSPASLILVQGTSGTSTIKVNPKYGFVGNVNLAVSGLPSGGTASFDTNPTTGTSVLTLAASGTSVTGIYNLTITGSSGTVTTWTGLALTVNPASIFTLGASPISINTNSGAFSQSTILVTFPSGFAGNVSLAVSGLPRNINAQFSPSTVSGTGTSVLTLTTLGSVSAGSYNLTITGASGSLTVNTTTVLTVVVPTFGISSSLGSGGLGQGSSVTSTITVTPLAGFTGSVSLAASNMPSGLTASFTPNPTTGTSLLTLTANSSATPGNVAVIITGTDGTSFANARINLSIVAVPTKFFLDPWPLALTVVQGASGTSTITVAGQGGFSGNVDLATSNLPEGVTASFSQNPTAGTSLITLSANSFAPPGVYNPLINGASGTLTATTYLILTIIPPPGFAPPGANFGPVNTGTASPEQTLTYTFGSAVTLGSTAVLTQGASGMDFADAGTGTCTADTYHTPGGTCTVNVTFTPKFAGVRNGAVVLNDNIGNAIATAYIQGTGVGPQVNFLPGTESTVVTASNGLVFPYGIAVDGAGNLYVADLVNNRVLKETLTASGYTQSTIPTSELFSPDGVAVDGAGNVYITDHDNNRVLKETLSMGGYTESVVANSSINGIMNPGAVAVDGSGNVYFTTGITGSLYKETLSAGSYTQSTIPTPGASSGAFGLSGVAVDGSGNVYVVNSGNDQVLKETLSSGVYVQSILPISGMVMPYTITVDGSGNVYIVDLSGNQVIKETPSNGTYIQSTISTSKLNYPHAVAVDGGGNVYISDGANMRVLKENLADAPSLTFASTAVGSTSSDSPQTVTVENIGNAALTFPVPSSGNNPDITANFTLNSSGASACPLVGAISSTAGTLTAGASCQLPISFTPTAAGTLNGSLALTDSNLNVTAPGYAVQNISLSGTGTQATPTITWSTPAPITYGTALSATQLNATSTVAGSFTYSPTAGTVLTAGQQTLTATFTPTDSTDYTTATASVTLTVNQATPTITWATPAPITYRTPLSAIQFNATSSVDGNWVYSPAVGTLLGAGQQTLTATFMPADTTDYTTATASVTLMVNKATPTISWPTPAPITYGTPIGDSQLNTTVTVAGTFTYLPASGTVLGAGQQTLTATFTPTDLTNYTPAMASVILTVNKATPTITWATPAAITYGTALGGSQLNAKSSMPGTFTYSPATGTVMNAGPQTLTATLSPTDSTDYTTATASVTLTVNKAVPTITWATPAAITYGTALSGTQLNAKSTVAGSFTYSPATGAVLNAGTQTLTATFAPADANDYTAPTASVKLTVNKAKLTISWATPAAINYGTALSGTQLNATSTADGMFTYSPTAGTVLGVGSHTLTATFKPTIASNYTTASATATVTLAVNKAIPTITWAAPKAVTYGTALSATQLNASSPVAGKFTYMPATGTVLTVGTHTLSVTFAPTDATDYNAVTVTVTLTVNKATPTVKLTSSASSIAYGKSLKFTTTVTGSGVIPTGHVSFFDGATQLGTSTLNASGVATYSTSKLAVGKHSITTSYGGDGNYLNANPTAIIVTVTAH